MDVVKLGKFNFLKKKVEKFGHQSKNLDHENRRLEHEVKILKDPNDVCECITNVLLYFFSVDKKKIDQVTSVALSKLTK